MCTAEWHSGDCGYGACARTIEGCQGGCLAMLLLIG